MERLRVRVDDVSPNTDMGDLNDTARYLRDTLKAEVIYGVTLFARKSESGSVYPDLPMRGRDFSYFCKVDKFFDPYIPRFVKIASHGLIHAEHGKLDRQTQELSIMVSCNLLRTRTFIPPFMSFNEDTFSVCRDNGIELITPDEWTSMETNSFNPDVRSWYFHPWRMKNSTVRKWVNASKINV